MRLITGGEDVVLKESDLLRSAGMVLPPELPFTGFGIHGALGPGSSGSFGPRRKRLATRGPGCGSCEGGFTQARHATVRAAGEVLDDAASEVRAFGPENSQGVGPSGGVGRATGARRAAQAEPAEPAWEGGHVPGENIPSQLVGLQPRAQAGPYGIVMGPSIFSDQARGDHAQKVVGSRRSGHDEEEPGALRVREAWQDVEKSGFF